MARPSRALPRKVFFAPRCASLHAGLIMESRVPRFFESKAEFARSLGKYLCEITSWLSVRKGDLFAVDLYGSDNAIVIAWNNRE